MWRPEPVERVIGKHMVIVGYGEIGAACAKIAKHGFGMKVTGIRRSTPPMLDQMGYEENSDAIVGLDKYDEVIADADFIVGILPKIPDQNEEFFNNESTFSKMKETAVFINIGSGYTVNEYELAKSLISKKIGGAVLDVYQHEPLDDRNLLWFSPNLLMTPHCANEDQDNKKRSLELFGANL